MEHRLEGRSRARRLAGSRLRSALDVPVAWRVVAVLAVTQLVSWGVLFHAFTVFLDPVRDDLGLSVAEVSGAFTVAVLVKGGVGLPVSYWVDRYGARPVMSLGSLGAVGSVLAWSRADTLTELYLAFAAVGACSAAVLYEPAFATAVRWFSKERATAILAITTVAGLAPTVFAPVSHVLVEQWGWRYALLVLAAVLGLCTVLPHALLLRSGPPPEARPGPPAPADEGAGGASEPAGQAPPGVWREVTAAARDPRSAWLCVAFAANTLAVAVVMVHLVPYLRASGRSGGAAVTALAGLGMLSLVGRVALTLLARRWQMPRAMVVSFATRSVAAAVLLALPGSTYAVVAFVVAFGLSSGIGTIGKATLVADVFGTAAYARLTAGLNVLLTGVRAFAPLAVGVALTATDSPAVVPGVVAGSGVLGVLAVLRGSTPVSASRT